MSDKLKTRNPYAKHVLNKYNKVIPGKRYDPDICPKCKGAGFYNLIKKDGYGKAVSCEKCSGSGTV